MRRDPPPGERVRGPGSGRARGQTAQDFAVGIGLFLLAVAFVFAFVPQVIAPYETGVGASEAAQADRAAALIAGNLSIDGRPNELDSANASNYFSTLSGPGELRNRTGLAFSARVNVTIANLSDGSIVTSGGTTWAGGASYPEGREAASATRIVRTDGSECEPACELVVRVW